MENAWGILFTSGVIWLQIVFVVVCVIALVYFLIKRLNDRDKEKFQKRKF